MLFSGLSGVPLAPPGPSASQGLPRGLPGTRASQDFFQSFFRDLTNASRPFPGASQETSRGCQKVPAHVVSIYGSHALLKGLPSPFQGPLKIQGCTFSALSKGLCWLTGLFKARIINFGSQETSLTSAGCGPACLRQ